MSTQKIKKAIGVEINTKLAATAKKNLINLRLKRAPVEIINTDAATFDIKEGTVFFMFNPFGYRTLEKVLNNIKKSLIINAREIRIIYIRPIYRDFLDSQEWLVMQKKIDNIDNTGCDVCIWHNRLPLQF